MSLENMIPALERYARSLTYRYHDEDYRDLVQDTIVKILNAKGADPEIAEGYMITVCKNAWRDRLAHKAITRNIQYLEDMPVQPFGYLPQVEVDIYCNQVGINLYQYSKSKAVNTTRVNRIVDPIKLAIRREMARLRSQRNRAKHK